MEAPRSASAAEPGLQVAASIADSFQRRPVAAFSETTATYDARGSFPTLRLFQIVRPVPVPRPFGSLFSEDIPPGGQRIVLNASYARFRRGPAPSNLVDHFA
ncbi:MAG: hypothetical protein D6679_05950 [Candidatus Hydrogenedentota bacterium]|nr:MAG: hypothetical protein D6679_05950 [Candidatus Hydrogenedentota bacterium]